MDYTIDETQEGRIEELVWANRILCNEKILDAFGHVSVRSERNDNHFLQSKYQSPQLVKREDIVTITLDGEVVEPVGASVYGERVMHGMIYEARPDVQAIVHTHALPLIPFSASQYELKPLYHMACMFGEGVPIYDDYDVSEGMLIRDHRQGRRLARVLGNQKGVLLRGHGALVVGRNLRDVVASSVNLVANAIAVLDAHRLGQPLKYLSLEECRAATEIILRDAALERAWNYFKENVPPHHRIPASMDF